MYSGSGMVIELPGTEKIRVDLDKCVGCRRCEMACSEAFTQRYNPLEHAEGFEGPRLRISRSYRNYIEFKENCTDCGICAHSCLFGALIQKNP